MNCVRLDGKNFHYLESGRKGITIFKLFELPSKNPLGAIKATFVTY